MRRQLDHLVRLATERPEQIEVRVLPFSAGAHPAFGGPFEILSFPSPRLPDYIVTFAETRELALGSAESVDLIRRIAKEMT
ncbi:Scr1 family TA system antitoxin-like transcriptional regulator [Micromonospora sp. NPDC002575]|uniref:Scr1 family TA system antitoxin-like transcriptional regulator n=1 Tax=Micromonospora sp. NPDC002575 TaxID=3364222 RepID=UPI00369ADCBC